MTVLPPTAFCSWCADVFAPVEYVTIPQGPDEPRFCSDHCRDLWTSAEDGEEAYESAGCPAPVFGA